MKLVNVRIFVTVVASIVFVLPRAGAAVLPETAKLLPPETVLLAQVDNFSQLKKQFEKTNLYKLYKDPAMAAFINNARAKWQEKTGQTDNKIFKAITRADVLPQGRVAFALALNEQTKDLNEPQILFITQWGQTIDKIKETVDKMVEKALENGAHQKTEDYRSLSIKTIMNEGSPAFSYSFFDDCLIGSMNLDVLKFVIAHIKGATSPTLADDTDFQAAIAASGPDHDIDFYVNIKQILKAALAEDTTGKARTIVANLGLDNVVALSCSIGIARAPASPYRGKAVLKIKGGKKGICKMFDMESAPFKAPRFIPASAYSITFVNLNIKKAYDELANILNSFNPMYASMLYMPLLPPSPEGEPGLELKGDIIDHLGSQIVLAQSINKPFSTTSQSTETFIALAVNNRIALEKSMSTLHGKVIAPNNPDARRELLGHTIYLVSLKALPIFRPPVTPMQTPAEPATPQLPTLAFTVTDTHLILGVESSVERAIRTLSSTEPASLDSAKWFTSAKSAIPSVVGLAGLQDNAASGELLWWMIKQIGKAGTSNLPIGPNPAMVFSQMGLELFDFGLLPEFDVVRKYFGLLAFYGVSRPDGFFCEFKYLNPTGSD